MRAEADQHDADRGFQRPGQMLWNCVADQERRSGEHEQRHRMTQSPSQPVLDDVGNTGPPRRDAGNSRDMIGLKRMLHSEKET